MLFSLFPFLLVCSFLYKKGLKSRKAHSLCQREPLSPTENATSKMPRQ